MKAKLICLLTFCLSTHIAIAQQNTVTLTGTLINFDNQTSVSDMSEFAHLNMPNAERAIVPDEKGYFTISFNLTEPNYFCIGWNQLYLSPGDKLNMVIDYNDPAKGKFIGIGAEANTYMANTPHSKSGSFLGAGDHLYEKPKETFDYIMNAAAARTKQLKALKGVSPEFKRLEAARIKADVLNSFNNVKTYAEDKKVKDIGSYMTVFKALALQIRTRYEQNFVDASLMKLIVYSDIAYNFVEGVPPNADVLKINDWYTARALANKMNRESDKTKLTEFKPKIDNIKTQAYSTALKGYLNGKLQFGKGDIAADFTAIDATGKQVNLSSLKGKVIYVDIWATWCEPCLAEMPKLEEVKAKYRDNANVVFLSLSTDRDSERENWKKNMADRKADGYQWQISGSKLNAYNIATIPRTLLIDKDFKMVSMSAPLPSDKGLIVAIDELLK